MALPYVRKESVMEALAEFQIVTNEISIKNNDMPAGDYKVNPQISRNTGKLGEERYYTELMFSLTNTEDNPFPIDLKVRMTGTFNLRNIDKEQIENFLKIQGVQILFPYVRTMVSNITSSAMMPPIILPVVDVLKLFGDTMAEDNTVSHDEIVSDGDTKKEAH